MTMYWQKDMCYENNNYIIIVGGWLGIKYVKRVKNVDYWSARRIETNDICVMGRLIVVQNERDCVNIYITVVIA